MTDDGALLSFPSNKAKLVLFDLKRLREERRRPSLPPSRLEKQRLSQRRHNESGGGGKSGVLECIKTTPPVAGCFGAPSQSV